MILGGTGELVALLDTLGCSGTFNLLSVDFHTGGLIFVSQFCGCVVLLSACIGILYKRIGRNSGESVTISDYIRLKNVRKIYFNGKTYYLDWMVVKVCDLVSRQLPNDPSCLEKILVPLLQRKYHF